MTMFTDRTRITGLGGIDTEEMVRQIMRAESQKLHRLQRRSTTFSWQQEAYRSMSAQMNSFRSQFLDILSPNSIRRTANMNSNSITSSNNSVAATITGNARTGRHQIRVDQLASRDLYTSNKSINASITGKEPFNHNNLKGGDSFRITLNGGQAREIKFTEEDLSNINSNEDFVKVLNEKLTTTFGTTNGSTPRVIADLDNQGRLTIDTNGTGNTITITEGTLSPSTITGKTMSQEDWAKLSGGKHTITVNGKDVTVDFSGFNEDKPLNQQEAIKLINDALKDQGFGEIQVSANASGEILFRGSGTSEDITLGGDLFNALTEAGTNGVLPRTNTLGALGGIQSGAQNSLDSNHSLSDIFGSDNFVNGEMTFTLNGVSITLKEDYTVEQMQNKINRSGAGVTLSYSNINQTFRLESNREGESNNIQFGADNKFAEMLNLQHNEGTGTNAKIVFNGVEIERETNSFDVDGIRLQLNNVSNEAITLEVRSDTEKTKQVLTDFVKEYNKLIESLNKERTTSRPRTNTGGHYEPLTDEEKREMTPEEIKNWEEQAKTGLLRGSDILTKATSDLRMQLNEPITLSDGTTVRLSDFGITTSSNFRDQGKLNIDEERLEAALQNFTGEQAAEFFGALGDKLDTTIADSNREINRRAGAESGTSNINNQLQGRINDIDSRMVNMRRLLARREEQLFAQFGRMEAAVIQSNSQMDLLISILGI